MAYLNGTINAEGGPEIDRCPPLVTWSVTPPGSDTGMIEDSREPVTVMTEPEEAPRSVFSIIIWSTRDINTLWEECRKAKLDCKSVGKRNQALWTIISRKLSTGRTPNACCKKYQDLQSIAIDVRKLWSREGLFWDQERLCIDGTPEAWAALSLDESLSHLTRHRGKVYSFLSLDDLDFHDRRKRAQPDNDEEGHDQEQEFCPRTIRRRGRPAGSRNRVRTRANAAELVDEGDDDELGLDHEEEHRPRMRHRRNSPAGSRGRGSIPATPAHYCDEGNHDDGPDVQDLALALPLQGPPLPTAPQPAPPPCATVIAQDEEKRSLQNHVRDMLKKDEKDGTWLKTAGRVKASELLRENVLLANECVEEEDDEARKIFLKGILRGRYDGNLRDLYDDA